MISDKFVVEGLPPLVPIPDQSVGEIIYSSLLSSKKEDSALIDSSTGNSITYSQLLTKSCSLAQALRRSRYGSNTTIAICSKNSLEYFVPVIASLYIGATVATINSSSTCKELLHITSLTKPEIIFCQKDLLNNFSKIKEKARFIQKLIVLDGDYTKEFIGKNNEFPVERFTPTSVNGNETAFILCSSGTTGLPKGVMLCHKNVNGVITHFRDPRIHDQNPITYCAVPFFHAYGLFLVLADLVQHSPTIFSPLFDAELLLKSTQNYKVTRLMLVPPIIVILTKCLDNFRYDLSSLKEVFSSAAPLNKRTEEAFKNKLRSPVIRQGYGLTEVTHCLMFNGIENSPPKYGSAGRVLPFLKVMVKDIETGKFLGPYGRGEICIKGDTVMKGYLNNPEANRTSFTEDGWYRTGDVGYYDEDGYFFITDRMKDLIKYKGFQVAPVEVEAVLLTHPDIIDAAVIGIPNELAGELPLAFVVKSKTSQISAKDVQDFVKDQLSPQKWLRGGVVFVEAIAKNQSGKILRKKLRDIFKNYMSKL